MMPSKFLPPMLCPIPKGHECHADNHRMDTSKVSLLLEKLRARTYNRFRITSEGFYDLAQPSAYYKLFAKRTFEKRTNTKPRRGQFIVYDAARKYITQTTTIAAAREVLKLDHVNHYSSRYSAWMMKPVPVGSYVQKSEDIWDLPDNRFPQRTAAVKRCGECPSKTERRGQCACALWSGLRDSTQKWQWMSLHEQKMYWKKVEKDTDSPAPSLEKMIRLKKG